MKKHYSIFCILFIAITLMACNKIEYKEMRVYPVQKELSAGQGDRSFIAIQVEIPAGYHLYGNPKGPGTGKPTQIFVKAPRDFNFYAARFLQPEKFYYPGEDEYTLGYERGTTVFVPFTVRENARTGVHSIAVTFDSLICNYSESGGFSNPAAACIPKLIRFDYPVRVIPRGSPGTVYHQALIADYGKSKAPEKQDEAVHDLPAADTARVDAALPAGLTFSPRFIQSGISGLLQAILFGIIAGFILNFMPCVLPVVSLKVMSFVQHADKSRRDVFLLGLTFSLGILASFAVLASLAAFFGYKWGGLFQHRIFLVVMTGIVFALALSLFGVYAINIPALAGRAAQKRENIFADAFIKGLFATLLATPCSGPFLGGTLAWTMSRPPEIIFVVFMSIGFGMSLPYVVLTAHPRFLKLVPKPGEWLKIFEQIMAFLLVLTTIYLVGIFDAESRMPMMVFLAFVGIGFWQYGKYGSLLQTGIRRIVSAVLLVVIILGGYFISFNYLYAVKGVQEIPQGDFSVARLLENRKAGRISMIEFTADWCPNCKLVEKTSLFTAPVASAIKDGNIDFMKADITRKNPAAEKLLSLFRNESIPLLAVIPPGESFAKPIILRDIYSGRDVLEAIEMAMKNGGKNKTVEYQIEMKIK